MKLSDLVARVPEFPVEPLDPAGMRDGIVVRMPNWLGDAVMALPALMQLRKILPRYAGLFVICPSGLCELFKSLPMVDVVVPLDKVHKIWSRYELQRVIKLNAGAGVLFNNSLRDAILMRLCGVRLLYGAKARGRGFLLKRSFPFPQRVSGDLNNLHHAGKYLAVVKALGAPGWDGTLPEFVVPSPVFDDNTRLKEVSSHPKLLTLAAGAAYGGAKRWSAGNFATVAEWWIRDGGIVATLGSRSERDGGDEIISRLPSGSGYNLAGETSLSELMYLLKQSVATLANDSGVMHLAAILGKPGVAIFGSTDWSATGPLSEQWRILYEKHSCSPCFKRECPDGAPCLEAITPAMAIEALAEASRQA